MFKHILYTLFAATLFSEYLNPMASSTQGEIESSYREHRYGDLQQYLYKALVASSCLYVGNETWTFVLEQAMENLSPIMLYFSFRTIVYTAENIMSSSSPQIPKDFYNTQETTWISLMAFRIISYIDADTCEHFGFGGSPRYIVEEIGKKLKEKLEFLNNLFKNNPGPNSIIVAFKSTFAFVLQMFETDIYLDNNPAWISQCTKSRWGWVGLWPNTFYFANLSEKAAVTFAGNRGNINKHRKDVFNQLKERINTLINEKHSDSELWGIFL